MGTLLDQLGDSIEKVFADGAYDSFDNYKLTETMTVTQLYFELLGYITRLRHKHVWKYLLMKSGAIDENYINNRVYKFCDAETSSAMN